MAVRERFDDFCLQQTLLAARQGGSIELRKIDRILALRESPDFIELDVATTHGPETLRAPILIGADGSNGQTRRLVEAARRSPLHSAPHDDGFALEATVPYTSLPATLPNGARPHDLVFDFAPLPGGYGWLFPKADHINIGVGAFARTGPPVALIHAQPQASDPRSPARLRPAKTRRHQALPTSPASNSAWVDTPTSPAAESSSSETLPASSTPSPAKASTPPSSAARPPPPPSSKRSQRTNDVAAAYARHLAPLQKTLTFSHRAARAFYAQPERGFKAMRLPFMRSLILKTYADGLPHTGLITALAKLTT